jgi:hypothetical protein
MIRPAPKPGTGSRSERPRRAAPRGPAVQIAPPSPPAPGTYRIAELRQDQCHFACTPHAARPDAHRFCGEPVAWKGGKPTAWCLEHLAKVYEASGRAPVETSAADGEVALVAVPDAPPATRRSIDVQPFSEADR